MQTSPDTTSDPKPAIPKFLIGIVTILLLGLVLFWQFYMGHFLRKGMEQENPGSTRYLDDRPPLSEPLTRELALVSDTGEAVNLNQLAGKVSLVAYVYTRCPRGCSFVAEKLKLFTDKYGRNPNFKAVAITLNPEEDTPEFMKAFRENKQMIGENYWFLRGDGNAIRTYMKDEFKLDVTEIPVAERSTAFDRWSHKLAIILVDPKRRIRSTADFSDPNTLSLSEQKLDRHIRYVLEEAGER